MNDSPACGQNVFVAAKPLRDEIVGQKRINSVRRQKVRNGGAVKVVNIYTCGSIRYLDCAQKWIAVTKAWVARFRSLFSRKSDFEMKAYKAVLASSYFSLTVA